jgi:hypothetical protein
MKRDDFESFKSPSFSALDDCVFSNEVKLFIELSCNVASDPMGKRRSEVGDCRSDLIVSFDCFEKSSSNAPEDTELQPVVKDSLDSLDEDVRLDLIEPIFDADAEATDNASLTDLEATVQGEIMSGCVKSIIKRFGTFSGLSSLTSAGGGGGGGGDG